MTSLVAEALSSDNFAPFGRVIDQPARTEDADGGGWRWWAEIDSLSSDGRPWVFGYLNLTPSPFTFDWAERHLRTEEVVLATSAELLHYVAAPIPGEPDRLPAFEDFHAFRIPPGKGVVMSPGVWHGAPFTVGGASNALILLLEGTGRDDVAVVRFPESPVHVEVSTS